MKLVVGAIIVNSLDLPTRVLAARRTDPPDLKGKWEFPGGKVEEGERPEDALVRELGEELGVEAVLGNELISPNVDGWRISDHLELRLWFVGIIGAEPISTDSHDELRWLSAETIEAVDWLEADKEALPFVFRR